MLKAIKIAVIFVLGLLVYWDWQTQFQTFAQDSDPESAQASDVEEAGLIDLSFQQDMQDSMRQLLSGFQSQPIPFDANLIDEALVVAVQDATSGILPARFEQVKFRLRLFRRSE